MTEKFVTLPRDVVELALNAFVKLQADDDVGLASWDFAEAGNACFALRAALEQQQGEQEPLTEDEIDKLCPQYDDPMRREMWIIGFKAAHNIK